MILDMIENYKLKREVKLAQWEKKRVQEFCPHSVIPLEQYRQGYSDGYGTEYVTIHPAYCHLCDKTFEFRSKIDLTHLLEKQEARECNGTLHK